jgi:hypothetical protein
MLDENRPHIMRLLRSTPDHGDEWFCPDCGRHLLLRWPPQYEQTLLVPGDESCAHVGGAQGELVAEAQLEAELVVAADALEAGAAAENVIDFGEPDRTDGLAPWRRLFDRLGREGF